MYKTTITETTKKYDKEGHLIEETVRTETTEDNELTYTSPLKFSEPYVSTINAKV